MENRINVAKTTAIAGTVGVGIGAASNAVKQIKILKHPDEFIAKIRGKIASQKKFNTPFFQGTQEAADLANKQLDIAFAKVRDFVTKGKINFKAVAKNAAMTGFAVACAAFIFTKLFDIGKKETRDNARIVADEFKKAKVGE